jgi:hypothetical protein
MLTVRRFFCDHIDCCACTFVEQVPGLTERHARPKLRSPGSVGGGRIGVGRAHRLTTGHQAGMGASRSTLLRLIRALPDPPVGQVTVLGVDEFALK